MSFCIFYLFPGDQIWARNMVGCHLGNSLVYTCALVYQTPDKAAEGYLGTSRQLIVCVCVFTDILYIFSVLYYQDLGKGNTNNHGRALAQLGSGIRNRTEALPTVYPGSMQGSSNNSPFSTSHTQQRTGQVWGEPQIKSSRVLGAGGGL